MARPGTWDFDADDDFLVCDGIETVQFEQSKADGGYRTAVTGIRGVREIPKRNTPIAIAGAVELAWHLNAADMPTITNIIEGDRITDSAGVKWIVQEDDLGGCIDQWQCRCIREVIPSSPIT